MMAKGFGSSQRRSNGNHDSLELQQIKTNPLRLLSMLEFYDGDGNKFDLTQRNAIIVEPLSTTGQVLPCR